MGIKLLAQWLQGAQQCPHPAGPESGGHRALTATPGWFWTTFRQPPLLTPTLQLLSSVWLLQSPQPIWERSPTPRRLISAQATPSLCPLREIRTTGWRGEPAVCPLHQQHWEEGLKFGIARTLVTPATPVPMSALKKGKSQAILVS